MLTEDGYVVLKFFLHIGPDEQKERLQARLDDPAKRWKFEPADLAERKHWDDYMKAYQDVIRKCSTPWAPWIVVPSNRKWYRNLVVASAIVDALQKLDLKLPEPDFDPSTIRIE
jgi:polyphosphate kinase 2 (PPK2 family)